MNAKQIASFLNSMDKSCEIYSSRTEKCRQRLEAVNSEFQKIDQNVKDSIAIAHKESLKKPSTQKPSRAQTPTNNSRRRPQTAQNRYPKMMIRPAPYPAKNYVLPAQELVGPKRYFRSRAAERRRKEKDDQLNEFEKFPCAFENSPRDEAPSMVVTASRTFNFKNEDENDDIWSFGSFSSRSESRGNA